MNRKELLQSPEYWAAGAQIELYNQARKFMESRGMNRKQLAAYLGVSNGYVSQLLNGDYDHRLSKFFELALAFGVIPRIDFVPVDEYVASDNVAARQRAVRTDIPDSGGWSGNAMRAGNQTDWHSHEAGKWGEDGHHSQVESRNSLVAKENNEYPFAA